MQTRRLRILSPEPPQLRTKIIMVLAAGFPSRLFSFRAPVSPAPAQPQLALPLLVARQVDQRHLALSLFHLVLRPDPCRLAGWLEVDGRQIVHALLRLALRQDPHQ